MGEPTRFEHSAQKMLFVRGERAILESLKQYNMGQNPPKEYEMKRGLLIVAIIALATFALSSCSFVLGMVLKPDLMVENIVVSVDPGTDEITTLRIYFYNNGGDAEDVSFVVVLTPDELVSPYAGDYVVYWGSFDIGWNQDKYVDINMADILQTIGDEWVPAGDYYIGVMVDPDDQIKEREETDNEATTPDRWLFGGGGSAGTVPEDTYEGSGGDSPYPGTTNELLWNSSQNHTFHDPSDEDWMFISVSAASTWVTIETAPLPDGINLANLDFEVYDGTGAFLHGAYSTEPDGIEILSFSAPIAGWYFIKTYEVYQNVGDYSIIWYY